MAYNLNQLTNTRESGAYYAGKDRADRAYGRVLSAQTPGAAGTGGQFGAGGLTSANAIRQSQQQAGYQKQAQDSLKNNPILNAATAAAESELQDELAAENQAQAKRTFDFAQAQASRPKTPGGSIRRGADMMSIGQATGSGLAKANADAKRKARMAEAAAKAQLQTSLMQAENRQRRGF